MRLTEGLIRQNSPLHPVSATHLSRCKALCRRCRARPPAYRPPAPHTLVANQNREGSLCHTRTRRPQRRPHAVTLDERSHLTVTGVDEVVRFDDTEVSMRTSRGMLTVHGEGLRVGRLAIDTGELAIDGAFDALDYTEETASGGGFWSRLFGG